MFIAALFTTARTWKQPRCPSTEEYIKKMWCIYTQWNIATAKSLQSCPTLCDPIDGSPPGSLSLGFSRQEHWSGLPFPSPVLESEKWQWSRSIVSDSQRPYGLQPTRSLHPWDFPGKSRNIYQSYTKSFRKSKRGKHVGTHFMRTDYWKKTLL